MQQLIVDAVGVKPLHRVRLSLFGLLHHFHDDLGQLFAPNEIAGDLVTDLKVVLVDEQSHPVRGIWASLHKAGDVDEVEEYHAVEFSEPQRIEVFADGDAIALALLDSVQDPVLAHPPKQDFGGAVLGHLLACELVEHIEAG